MNPMTFRVDSASIASYVPAAPVSAMIFMSGSLPKYSSPTVLPISSKACANAAALPLSMMTSAVQSLAMTLAPMPPSICMRRIS